MMMIIIMITIKCNKMMMMMMVMMVMMVMSIQRSSDEDGCLASFFHKAQGQMLASLSNRPFWSDQNGLPHGLPRLKMVG